MLTQSRLKELLHYDKRNGQFYWRVTTTGHIQAGRRAGWKETKGYWNIQINNVNYKAHRLVWLYVYGRFPKRQLDHKNGDKADNRLTNLREATSNQNQWATKLRLTNNSGFKGAHWLRGKWQAAVSHNGKRTYLGLFPTALAAHRAYCRAAKELHGKFFHRGY